MTPEQRQEARARCEKATPGHWTAYWRYGMEHPSVGWLGPYAEGIDAFATGEAGGWCNAAFAAHARTDLPAALDALDAADAREQEKDARIVELEAERDSARHDVAKAYAKRRRALERIKELRSLNMVRIAAFCEQRLCVFSDSHHELVNHLRCECRRWKAQLEACQAADVCWKENLDERDQLRAERDAALEQVDGMRAALEVCCADICAVNRLDCSSREECPVGFALSAPPSGELARLRAERDRYRAALEELAGALEQDGRFPNTVPAIRAALDGTP